MKLKIFLTVGLLAVSALLIFAMGKKTNEMKTVSYFQNENTFIIIAKGKPVEGEEDKLKRQYQAERAAISVAQFEMSLKLHGFKVLDQKKEKSVFDKHQTCTLTYVVKVER